jgi:hypothetical protein
VDEVPGLERAFLTLHHEQTLAAQDEETLLTRFLVVHRHRHSRWQHVQVDPELLERSVVLALETAISTELVVQPARITSIDDEPALACGTPPSSFASGTIA